MADHTSTRYVKKMVFEGANIISLGEMIKMSPLKQISASLKFAMCDFSKDYDFFIFSGNWAHFAARRRKPNFSNCRSTNYFCKRWGKPQTSGSAADGGGLNENPAFN